MEAVKPIYESVPYVLNISNKSAFAPEAENILRKESGRISDGISEVENGNNFLTVVKKLQISSSAPELRKIPTATSSPIKEGDISKTVRSPCFAPLRKRSNTGFLSSRA